ncbi:hypothetical protein [Campylobacter upsaliensis]|uniref:hypothetical protein n=1 Tax=Campylobacter upsaliensis TaxID=28080 RepID=UPI0022EABD3E|nr:hypothetical protein [Campylobacter upsaliensis]
MLYQSLSISLLVSLAIPNAHKYADKILPIHIDPTQKQGGRISSPLPLSFQLEL